MNAANCAVLQTKPRHLPKRDSEIDGTIHRTVALQEARRSRPLERGRSDRHGGRTAKGRGGSILKGYPSEESCPGSHPQFRADPRHREWLCEGDAYANASIDDPLGNRLSIKRASAQRQDFSALLLRVRVSRSRKHRNRQRYQMPRIH